jgi:hypothetical protein
VAVQYVSRVDYLNPLLLPLELYPRIRIEPGVDVRFPAIIPTERMIELSRNSAAPGGALGTVGGLTEAYFYIEFSDFRSQWRLVRIAGARESFWQFQGGVITLAVGIKIFVRDTYDPGKDATTLAIFALILEHELHHVFDEIDLIKQDMPSQARSHPVFLRWLHRQEPVPPNDFNRLFNGYSAPRLITDDVWSRLDERPPGFGLEALLLPVWIDGHNLKNRERHHRELQRYQTRIDDLERAQVNGRLWSGGAGSDPWRD